MTFAKVFLKNEFFHAWFPDQLVFQKRWNPTLIYGGKVSNLSEKMEKNQETN